MSVVALMRELEKELEDELDDALSEQVTSKQVTLFDTLQAWFPNNPLLWNACKHMVKAEQGAKLEELEKALWYLQQEIKRCKPSSSS